LQRAAAQGRHFAILHKLRESLAHSHFFAFQGRLLRMIEKRGGVTFRLRSAVSISMPSASYTRPRCAAGQPSRRQADRPRRGFVAGNMSATVWQPASAHATGRSAEELARRLGTSPHRITGFQRVLRSSGPAVRPRSLEMTNERSTRAKDNLSARPVVRWFPGSKDNARYFSTDILR
jgi:hypothetical protein